jgi:hypothetical protein
VRIGLAVDGQAEVASLPVAKRRLEELSGHTLLGPILVPMSGLVPPAAIAAECVSRTGILIAKRIDFFVVLLDRESNQSCCGKIASAIERELARAFDIRSAVVVKDRMFENWLIADLDALAASPGRFQISSALRRRVQPNKADGVVAAREIKAAVVKGSYDKVADAKRILDRADPLRMAQHSRSFRKLLRTIDVPPYRKQSKNPD